MNLRDQLRQILPEILSENPSDSIKGTELIRLVKYRLHQEYSDATLRYHFSIMSCDPTSPIAKVEQGQGYYHRTTTIHSFNSARNLIPNRQGVLGEGFQLTSQQVDLALARAEKFRAIFTRHNEINHRFPFTFEESFSEGVRAQNLWRYPDAVLLDWHVAMASEDGLEIDPTLLDLFRNSGSPPFTLSSIKMKLELTHEDLREDFFQCLSNSLWAHTGELVVAAPLTDEKLLEDLRTLGNHFAIGITSYGLDVATLDELPDAPTVKALNSREFEAIESHIALQKISLAAPRRSLLWPQISELRLESTEFEELFQWISRSLRDRKPSTYRSYRRHSPKPKTQAPEVPGPEHVALSATPS